jgi:gluconolactonase
MFAAPPEIDARPVATLPDELRTGSDDPHRPQPSPDAKDFLEGPCFAPDGRLWCVDVVNGRLYSVGAAGDFRVELDYDGVPNGLKIRPDGEVLIADHRYGIMRFRPGGTTVEPLVDEWEGRPFLGVNDLFLTADGAVYFTDQGNSGWQDPCGRLFHLAADGTLTCLLEGIPSPNGLVPNADESIVWLAVTRANAVWRVPIAGGVQKVGTYVQLSGGVGPDGLALDPRGRLVVAHPGIGTVWLFDENGEPLRRIRTPGGLWPTNIAFRNERELLITESRTGRIYEAVLDC